MNISIYVLGMVASDAAFPAIETPRLRLRLAEPRDAPALAALMSDGVSRRLASWPVPYTPEMALDRIAGVRQAAADGASLPLIIEQRADAAAIGWISISRAPGDGRTAFITYWLGEGFQGRGLMREAAPAAMAEAFRRMDILRVRAAVQPDNAQSLSVVRMLGMDPLGLGRIWCPARGRDEECLWFETARADVTAAAE